MKSAFSLVGATLLLSLAPATANAKGSGIGIYALIDHVTFDQEGPTPNSIRIYGVFIVPQRMASGAYQQPQRGYLYFQIPPGAEEATRKDWAQLKAVAGTRQVVGFTFYWVPNPNDPQGNPHHSFRSASTLRWGYRAAGSLPSCESAGRSKGGRPHRFLFR